MYSLLRKRGTGAVDPLILKRAETTQKAHKVELSQTKEFKRVHHGPINSIKTEHIERRYLVSGGGDGLLHVYDLQQEGRPAQIEPIASVATQDRHSYAVSSVGWFPFDTGILVSASFDETVRIWDTNLMEPVTTFDLGAKVFCQAMSPIASHCLVATASDNPHIRLCDIKSGASAHTLIGHTGSVYCCVWSNYQDHVLYTGGEDGTIRVWDIRKASACLGSLDNENAEFTKIETNRAHQKAVNGLVLTLDGSSLVSLGLDERIKRWSTYDHRHSRTHYAGSGVRNHVRHNCGLAVSDTDVWPPLVYVPNQDHIAVFDVNRGNRVQKLCGMYGRPTCVDVEGLDVYAAGVEAEILVWGPLPPFDSEPGIEEVINGLSQKGNFKMNDFYFSILFYFI
ncbi:WD40-repeat-containing domain protein [Phycomyces blakesleeanus]